MGLYLCIFEVDEDIGGVDVGAYSDFGRFRDTVGERLEAKLAGSRFPTLMLHSDCDGQWTCEECKLLIAELDSIAAEFKGIPPVAFPAGWQQSVADRENLVPKSLYDCFIDVDGEHLIERIRWLCTLAIESQLPISFQ